MQSPNAVGISKLVIVVPTYNESKNIEPLFEAVFRCAPYAKILVVDDASPDHTGKIIKDFSLRDERVMLLSRPQKSGIGSAYIDGLTKALELGADFVITMDADLSHDPEYIPVLVGLAKDYDVVIGSRYVRGGGTENWESWRKFLSWGGVTFTKFLFGLRIKDCTAGFKCYSRRFLSSLNLRALSAQGYVFQVEMVFSAHKLGFPMIETPIIFKDRLHGKSKVNLSEITRFFIEALKIYFWSWQGIIKANVNSPDFQRFNKDFYREKENYDWTAVADKVRGLETFFHRFRARAVLKVIDRFGVSGKFLDAGCGTGLLLRRLPTGSVGLDINPRNIEKAKKYSPHAELVLGDLESMPFPDGFFSTVVCTEVIEHQPNPKRTLSEINRVLKDGGVVIGSVPRRSFWWRFRFLSATCPGSEPFHKEYRLSELKNLLTSYFEVILIKSAVFCMNIIFTCRKK